MNKVEQNGEATELLSRKEIKDTPFQVVSIAEENKHFAILGEYRITEKYDTAKEAEKEVVKMTWNRIIQVMMILQEKLKDKKI